MSEDPRPNPLFLKSFLDLLENDSEDEADWESGVDDEEDPNVYNMVEEYEVEVEMDVSQDANVAGKKNELLDIGNIQVHSVDDLTLSSPQVQQYPPGQASSISAAAVAREKAMRRTLVARPEPQTTRERSPIPKLPPQLLGQSAEDADIKHLPHAVRYAFPPPPVDSRTSTSDSNSPEDRSMFLSAPHYNLLSSLVYPYDASQAAERMNLLYNDTPQPSRGSELTPRGRVRGQSRARGTKPRGGNRGGNHRAAYMAVEGDIEWRRGNPIVEVCKNDEDIPPRLREMLYEPERIRRERRMRSVRRNAGVGDEDDVEEDEFHAAESFMVHEMFAGDRQALEFNWFPMTSFRGQAEHFLSKSGPNMNFSSAYETFRYFWDDDILEHIVKETNRYAAGLKESSERFAKCWYDTNVHEILILFAFWMMLGVIRMPTIRSCFSNNPLLKTCVFRTLLTENRYWHLHKALHLVDNATRTPESSKLFCLGSVPEHLNNKFKNAYTPGQNIVIEESLTLGKGNLLFRQFIKTEAARLGIKTFELCESATGYLWSFIIYTVKNGPTVAPRLPQSTDVVVQLVKPLLNKGYRVFMDNTLNSPLLARYLKRNKTDCVGTLRKDKTNVPVLIQHAVIPEGACVARHSGDVVVMACQDKKPVYTISTCHGTESVPFESKPGKAAYFKPAIIVDYNRFKAAIAKKDQMLEPYLVERENNRKWYINIFKYLLNVSTFNSRILVDSSITSEIKAQAFYLELVDSIMKNHLSQVPYQRRNETVRSGIFPELRFSRDGHYLVRSKSKKTKALPENSETRSRKHRRSCRWCLVREARRRQTVYVCEACDVPLCIEGCFKKYHTVA